MTTVVDLEKEFELTKLKIVKKENIKEGNECNIICKNKDWIDDL